MSGLPVVFSPRYSIDIGPHVFPMRKYALVAERLVGEGIIARADIQEPEPASDEDVTRVHDPGYASRLRQGTLALEEILQLEMPWSPGLADLAWLASGGTLAAARAALAHGLAAHIGGGFHHAFPDHGEGFCALHDVAIALARLLRDGAIARALVVDLDVHQGNGTAAIFAGEPRVITFSMHQENNYPRIKPPSDLDIGLDDGMEGPEYLALLHEHLPRLLATAQPELVLYVAGVDPYLHDQLGGLALRLTDLAERDRTVIEMARDAGAAVALTLAGGYARRLEDTVTAHARTVEMAAARFARERVGDSR